MICNGSGGAINSIDSNIKIKSSRFLWNLAIQSGGALALSCLKCNNIRIIFF